MDPSSIVLQGWRQAEVQAETAAAAIAGVGGASAHGNNPDVVNLSAEMLALISAQTSIAANIATIETVDPKQKTLLDVTA